LLCGLFATEFLLLFSAGVENLGDLDIHNQRKCISSINDTSCIIFFHKTFASFDDFAKKKKWKKIAHHANLVRMVASARQAKSYRARYDLFMPGIKGKFS
jgi:hypothetical protein